MTHFNADQYLTWKRLSSEGHKDEKCTNNELLVYTCNVDWNLYYSLYPDKIYASSSICFDVTRQMYFSLIDIYLVLARIPLMSSGVTLILKNMISTPFL